MAQTDPWANIGFTGDLSNLDSMLEAHRGGKSEGHYQDKSDVWISGTGGMLDLPPELANLFGGHGGMYYGGDGKFSIQRHGAPEGDKYDMTTGFYELQGDRLVRQGGQHDFRRQSGADKFKEVAGNSLAMMSMTPGGGLMGMFDPAKYMGLSGVGGSMINGAVRGGIGTSIGGGDFKDGFMAGGLTGGLNSVNPAGTIGITNPIAGKAVNSAISGGLQTAAAGGDPWEGLKAGGISGGLSGAISQGVRSSFTPQTGETSMPRYSQAPGITGNNQSYGAYQPTATRGVIDDFLGQSRPDYMQHSTLADLMQAPAYSPRPQNQSYRQYEPSAARGAIDELLGQSRPEQYQNQSPLMDAQPMMYSSAAPSEQLAGLESTAFSAPGGGGSMFNGTGTGAFSSWLESDIGKKFNQLLGNINPETFGNNLVRAGMGLYGYNKANKAYKQQIAGLNSLFSQDSPYAQHMRQALARKDAAGGRRSQYGPREVELQARLAEMASRQAPTLQALYQGQNQNRDRLLNTGMKMFNDMGGFGSLQKLFGGGMPRPTASPMMGPFNYSDGFQPDPYAGV